MNGASWMRILWIVILCLTSYCCTSQNWYEGVRVRSDLQAVDAQPEEIESLPSYDEYERKRKRK